MLITCPPIALEVVLESSAKPCIGYQNLVAQKIQEPLTPTGVVGSHFTLHSSWDLPVFDGLGQIKECLYISDDMVLSIEKSLWPPLKTCSHL